MEKVSIIIPVYNIKKYLEKCVESACDQTYKNMEILLVDDGSTDGSSSICDELAKKDSRIIVVHKENGGLSSARNAGLEIATGKYIYFLDGDDTIENNLIENAVKHMKKGFDMVCFGYQKVYLDGVCREINFQVRAYEFNSEEERIDFIISIFLNYCIGWEAWNRMYLRANIEKYNLRFFDNKKIFAEDIHFCLCYCAHVKKIKCISGCYYNYMQRKDSIMGEQSRRLNIGRMNELVKAVKLYFEESPNCQKIVEVIPIIHFWIIKDMINTALKHKLVTWRTVYKAVLGDVDDIKFFKNQLRKLHGFKRFLEKYYSGSQVAEDLSLARYLVNGSYFGLRVRNRLIYKYSKYFDIRTENSKNIEKQYIDFKRRNNKIYLIGTEDFGNIGDHQIAESILEFIKQYCPECNIFEVTASEYFKHRVFLKKYIKKKIQLC